MPLLVLFDIDGTILRYKTNRAKQIFADIILDIFDKEITPEEMPAFCGMTDLQILKSIGESVGLPYSEIQKNSHSIWSGMLKVFQQFINTDTVEILPGVEQLIKKMNSRDDVQLGLLTGNFRENAYLKLSVFNLEKFFPFGAFGSDHENRNLLVDIAINRANDFAECDYFSTNNSVIIGDSPRDIECAKFNNMPVVSVATGSLSSKELNDFSPDLIFEDFSEYNKIFDIIINNFLQK